MDDEDSGLKCKLRRVYSLRNSRRRRNSVQVSKLYMANIYAVYALISGNPGGGGQFCSLILSPRWGGGGELECFCTFAAGSTGEDPRDL